MMSVAAWSGVFVSADTASSAPATTARTPGRRDERAAGRGRARGSTRPSGHGVCGPARRARRATPVPPDVLPHPVEVDVVQAAEVITGGCHCRRARAGTASAADSSRPARSDSVSCASSALLTAMTSASSRIPPLHALQLVTGAGQRQEQERVDHVRDDVLRLPDADRLDQHDVVAGRLHDQHRLAGGLGDAAERAGRRRGPDERGSRWRAGSFGSCRRGSSRRCGRTRGRRRARRPGGRRRSG